MIPRDFTPPFSYIEWQWFEADSENIYKRGEFWKYVCKACGSVVVERWKQGHAQLHWNRKEISEGMLNPFI